MPDTFELAVGFGADQAAANRFCQEIALRCHPIVIGRYKIEFRTPHVEQMDSSTEFSYFIVSVSPIALGYNDGFDLERVELLRTTMGLSALGNAFYSLLRGLDGYELAYVAWEAAHQVNLEDLKQDWVKEDIEDGSFTGLVVAHKLRAALPASPHFVPFDDKHDWIPYEGTLSVEDRNQLYPLS